MRIVDAETDLELSGTLQLVTASVGVYTDARGHRRYVRYMLENYGQEARIQEWANPKELLIQFERRMTVV